MVALKSINMTRFDYIIDETRTKEEKIKMHDISNLNCEIITA